MPLPVHQRRRVWFTRRLRAHSLIRVVQVLERLALDAGTVCEDEPPLLQRYRLHKDNDDHLHWVTADASCVDSARTHRLWLLSRRVRPEKALWKASVVAPLIRLRVNHDTRRLRRRRDILHACQQFQRPPRLDMPIYVGDEDRTGVARPG